MLFQKRVRNLVTSSGLRDDLRTLNIVRNLISYFAVGSEISGKALFLQMIKTKNVELLELYRFIIFSKRFGRNFDAPKRPK